MELDFWAVENLDRVPTGIVELQHFEDVTFRRLFLGADAKLDAGLR